MNWRDMQALAARLALSDMEPLFMRGGWLAVHAETKCQAPCPVHAPSDHPMKMMPLVWRGDRGFFERHCPHGTGHPDPDDLAFKQAVMTSEDYRRMAFGVHGCCERRCCSED